MSVVNNAKDGIQLILRYINNNSLLDEFVAIVSISLLLLSLILQLF